MSEKCEMCKCECNLTLHHLIPQSRCKNKYKQVKDEASNHIMICRECHDFLHTQFDNTYLRDNLNTIEKILENEDVKKFINWRKKHPDFKGSSKMSREQKLKRN